MKKKYDFLMIRDYDCADPKKSHVVEVPEGFSPFCVSRWPVPGQGIEFWFLREHVRQRNGNRGEGK